MRTRARRLRTVAIFCMLAVTGIFTAACEQSEVFSPETGNVASVDEAPAASHSGRILTTEAGIFQFSAAEELADQVGSSVLKRGKNGITMRMHIATDFPGNEGTGTEGSLRGHAVTIWALVFNNPDDCENPLGPAVLCSPGEDIGLSGGDVLRVTGKPVGQGPGVTFSDRIKVEDPGIATGNGLTNPQGAEIHLIVRTHGPDLPGVDQLSSPGAGCEGADLDRGEIPTEEGQCSDVAAGVHGPAGS